MGEYFKPWRRKIGFVTLAMACAFAGLWVRSFGCRDYVQWNCGCCSANGDLYVILLDPSVMSWSWWPEWTVTNVVAGDEESILDSFTWKAQIIGFGVGVFTILRTNFFVIFFPYSSIVIPLTLISAWLLLKKPKPSTPKKLSELGQDEGGAAT